MARAVVRDEVDLGTEGGVVVGDDGSRCAAVAVREAADEARHRGLPLFVVRAWSIVTAVRPADVPAGIVPSLTELESATLADEESRVTDLLRGHDAPPRVTVQVVHAGAVKGLLAAGRSADLLVVGTRGGGGFQQLLLGSVAEQCARHATCSVLVVRG